jgi:hypothetical protein
MPKHAKKEVSLWYYGILGLICKSTIQVRSRFDGDSFPGEFVQDMSHGKFEMFKIHFVGGFQGEDSMSCQRCHAMLDNAWGVPIDRCNNDE